MYKFKKKTEDIHEKAIINGKLFDTEKGELVCLYRKNRILLKTKKGNYFSCERDISNHRHAENGEITETTRVYHSDIREETEEAVKDYLGKNDMDLYIKFFGEVEEA